MSSFAEYTEESMRREIQARLDKDGAYGVLKPEQYRCLPREEREIIEWVLHCLRVSIKVHEDPVIPVDSLIGCGLSLQDIEKAETGFSLPDLETGNKNIILRRIASMALGDAYEVMNPYYDHWLMMRHRRMKTKQTKRTN